VWSSSGLQYADFTGDGILDQISTTPGGVIVWTGRSDGTFGGGWTSYSPNAGLLAVADFNGDGRLDVFTASAGNSEQQAMPALGDALLGRGDGTFDLEGTYVFGEIEFPTGIGTIGGMGQAGVVVAGLSWYGVPDVFVELFNDGNWPPPAPQPLPVPSISINDVTLAEGNTGTRAATFTVALSRASNADVTVHYFTEDGSATTGSDYLAASGTLIIPAGQTTSTVTVPVIGDRLPGPNETFFVHLESPTNATIGDSQGVGTIVDDEPRISIGDVTKSEGRRGQTTLFTFTVTLTVAYDQPVTMSFRTVNGTAKTSDSDYVARAGTLTFAPGETTKTITIVVNGDNKREANETFYVDLTGLSSNGMFTKYRGIGTILNDD
jgi:hypothetical protein